MVTQPNTHQWALMSYRVPREPSTPRIAIWRRLKKHGVVQVGDGLVALPFDARTKEHLEWVASMVIEADGEAIVWVASTTKRDDARLAATMNDERDDEYRELVHEISTVGAAASPRTIARLRRTWRDIDRRDYLRAPLRDQARLALGELTADHVAPDEQDASTQAKST